MRDEKERLTNPSLLDYPERIAMALAEYRPAFVASRDRVTRAVS